MVEYTLVPRDLFVVGDLFEKREKMNLHPEFFQRELEVLEKVFPEMEDPIISLGAHWIPPKVYERWTVEEFNVQTKWFYSSVLSSWDVQVLNPSEISNTTNTMIKGFAWIANQQLNLADPSLKVRYGTIEFEDMRSKEILDYIPAIDTGAKGRKGLIQLLLDRSTPKCKVTILTEEGEKSVNCPVSENKALTRMRRLGKEFALWCASSVYATELKEIYNCSFNREATLNRIDQGEFLTLYGVDADWEKRLRTYQKDIVASAMLGNFLAGAEVGLGKTFSGIAAAMQRIFYRTASKALIVVQKSTLSDYEKAARTLYPDARILVVSDKDCEAINRAYFLGKVAFHPWDLVIMHHDMFDALPFRKEVETKFQNNYLVEVQQEILWYESMGEVSKTKGKKTSNRNLKKLEDERNRIAARLKELAVKNDCGLHLEDLGFDYFVIDECDRYKSAYIKTRLKGINGVNCTNTSRRAMHFQLFCDWANDKFQEKALLFLTGTPEPDNWIGGVFVYQRFLQPSILKTKGLLGFDAWANMFGEIETKMELKIAGAIALTTRFCKYRNISMLMKTWKQNAEMWRYQQVEYQIKEKRPKAEIIEVLCPPSRSTQDYLLELAERLRLSNKFKPKMFAKRNRSGALYSNQSHELIKATGDYKKARILRHPITKAPITSVTEALEFGFTPLKVRDSWYSINHEGRCLMLAPQLLDAWMWERIGYEQIPEVNPEEKTPQCIDLVIKNYNPEEVQIIFCDTGVPNGSARFPIYRYIKEELIKRGIPKNRIGFIQSCKNKQEREKFFADINDGKINVVLMSTQKGGIGVNIQKRAKYMYLLDVLAKPSWLEQRIGRIVRSGNMHSKVYIYQFLTVGNNGSGSLDAFYSAMNQRKIAAREQLWTCTKNEMEGDGVDQRLFLQHTASASGNELLEEYSRLLLLLEEEEDRLTSVSQQCSLLQKSKYDDGIPGLRKNLDMFMKKRNECLEDAEKAITAIPNCTGEEWEMRIGDRVCGAKVADNQLQQALSDAKLKFLMSEEMSGNYFTIGTYGSFDIKVRFSKWGREDENCQVDSCLRGDYDYKFNWVVSKGKIVHRLEETLMTIASSQAKYDKYIAEIEAKIDSAELKLEQLSSEIPALRDRVAEMDERKAVLEIELGLAEV